MYRNKGEKALNETLIKRACEAKQDTGYITSTESHKKALEQFLNAIKEKKPFDAILLTGKNDTGANKPSDGLNLLGKISKYLSPKNTIMITGNPVLINPVQGVRGKVIKPNASFDKMLDAVSKTIYA